MGNLTNEEQEKLQEIINQKQAMPVNVFNQKQEVANVQKPQDEAGDLVQNVFNQAVVTKVTEDQELQGEILDTAKKYTKTKMDIVKNKVDKEDKEAYFDNNAAACDCFGYNEKTTEKWAVKWMKGWHNVMNGIWIIIGFFTYAPITFIAKKITVIFKKTWLAVLLAILLYLGLTLSPLWLNLLQIVN